MNSTNHNISISSERFASWARSELFDDAHKRGSEILDAAVDLHLINLYIKLDLHEKLAEFQTSEQLVAELGFIDNGVVALDAMLQRLSKRHEFLTTREEGAHFSYRSLLQPESDPAQLKQLTDEMMTLGTDFDAPLEFLAFGAEYFIHSLRDDHEFMDRVLTGQESSHSKTWHRATNVDPLQDIHGIMGAKAVELLFTGGSILEVGGGTGNGLTNNLAALDNGGKINTLENYIFTDVSMPFIVNTRRATKQTFPDAKCEWRLLNINKSFTEQRIQPQSVDMIYGVNAAHIAKEMIEFLQQCRSTLKPGGLIVFSERVRHNLEMAPREIVLNQSSYHRTAAVRHPDYRPAHAYLSRTHWQNAFETAGFQDISIWPNQHSLQDYYPAQYAAVIIARNTA